MSAVSGWRLMSADGSMTTGRYVRIVSVAATATWWRCPAVGTRRCIYCPSRARTVEATTSRIASFHPRPVVPAGSGSVRRRLQRCVCHVRPALRQGLAAGVGELPRRPVSRYAQVGVRRKSRSPSRPRHGRSGCCHRTGHRSGLRRFVDFSRTTSRRSRPRSWRLREGYRVRRARQALHHDSAWVPTRARPERERRSGSSPVTLGQTIPGGRRRPPSARPTRQSTFGAIAGRDVVKDLAGPGPPDGHASPGTRITAPLFENVGQWKRPWYYPRGR